MPALCSSFTIPLELLPPGRLRDLPRIGRLRREEGGGAVAPVVCQGFAGEGVEFLRFVFIELLDWEELDGGDAQLLEVRDLFDDAAEGARCLSPDEGCTVSPLTWVS